MKRCALCNEEKPLDDFYVNRKAEDGRMWRCKVCVKAKQKTYNVDLEKRTARWKRENASEAGKAATARWRERHPEEYAAYRKRYRDEHREEIAAKWADYYLANHERLRQNFQRWSQENPETRRASRNPELQRQDRERRRARLLDAFVEDVPFDLILQRDEGHCGICRQPIMENTIELDHVIPLAAGGTHERGNLQLAHRACNRRKHVKQTA